MIRKCSLLTIRLMFHDICLSLFSLGLFLFDAQGANFYIPTIITHRGSTVDGGNLKRGVSLSAPSYQLHLLSQIQGRIARAYAVHPIPPLPPFSATGTPSSSCMREMCPPRAFSNLGFVGGIRKWHQTRRVDF